MCDIKCPLCQNNLHKINIIVSTCTNDKCKLWGSSIPNLVLGALTQAKQDLERTREVLDKGMEHITGLNNMIESWYKLLQGDKDASTKYAILKSAISAYVENKGGNNE